MTSVTIPSLAYVATQVRILAHNRQSFQVLREHLQVRFALSSSPVFSRNDKVTDSERFYRSIVEFLEEPSEKEEVSALLKWWNV